MGWMHGPRRQALPLLLSIALAAPALAVGPPPKRYPERIDPPASAAERDARCTAMAARVARTRADLKAENVFGRWDFIRTRHRKAERFLKEYCGQATADGLALSHRAAARADRPDLHHPDVTEPPSPGRHDDDHH